MPTPAVGEFAVSVDDLSVDLLSIASHKLCAPQGSELST